ncbi:sulfotransferase domain-containing protein [Marininema halotolerans]|uniref:Sulfotransferase domain-containing protein n=1 Tax=Marininema halotolerans TaxID=1155944 RepID=A0A1I6TRE7_9BACL|nr:sulfotransferase domain-containing protein [Marininema halotolerans]SFS91772.1 Sulfotransferase domain-containing protein [Marininema halotolerans]
MNQPVIMPKVLVISVPKSGTHLLLQLMMGIPGVTMLQKDNPWCYETDLAQLRMMKPGQVALSHFPYAPRYLQFFRRQGIKVVFISRDPRDVVVSLVHFMMKPSTVFGKKNHNRHFMYRYMHHLPNQEQRLLAVIKGVRPNRKQVKRLGKCDWPNFTQYTSMNYDWRGKPGICSVTFEEMMRSGGSRNQATLKMVDHIWEGNVPVPFAKKIMARKMMQNIKPSESSTFRNGRIGNWRSEFTPKVKQAFKEETRNLLQRLGYERSSNW